MKKLILVCGPAGIGKSTFCRHYIAIHPEEEVHIISSDEIRKTMCGAYDRFPPNHNMNLIYGAMNEEAIRLYHEKNALTLLFDTTMLNDERRLYFLDHLPHFDETDLYLLKLHRWETCLERNRQRQSEKWVPEEVVKDMIACYRDPTPEVARRFDHIETFYLD